MTLTLTRPDQRADSTTTSSVARRAIVPLSLTLLGLSIATLHGGGVVATLTDWTVTWLNIPVGQQAAIAIPAVLAGAVAAAVPARRSDRS